jgi:hypothetical protein
MIFGLIFLKSPKSLLVHGIVIRDTTAYIPKANGLPTREKGAAAMSKSVTPQASTYTLLGKLWRRT